jgi:hypothetical protein
MTQPPFGNRFAPLGADDKAEDEDDEMHSDPGIASNTLSRRPGREKRKKSTKPRSTSTSSEEFDEALQSMREIDDVGGWEKTEISDSALEDNTDMLPESSRRGTMTNDHFLQTAFRTAAKSITATALELPRGPHGRGGGFIKKSPNIDTLGPRSPVRLPQQGPVQPILPTHTLPEQTESKTMFNFQAQLTFGLQPHREVNVAILFSRFLANAIKSVPDFSLLPYNDEKGQQVTATTQLPDNNSDFYATESYNMAI